MFVPFFTFFSIFSFKLQEVQVSISTTSFYCNNSSKHCEDKCHDKILEKNNVQSSKQSPKILAKSMSSTPLKAELGPLEKEESKPSPIIQTPKVEVEFVDAFHDLNEPSVEAKVEK